MPTIAEVLEESELRMMGAVEVLSDALRGVRTGRASTGLVENIEVEAYGTKSPLKTIAGISTPDARLIMIRPYDPSVLSAIEKAILASEIGLTPASDGKIIRLAVPPLSEERRKQLAALVRSKAEEAKIAVRNVRRDTNREIDRMKKDGDAPEDDCFKAKERLQNATKEQEDEVDALIEKKTREISEV